MTVADLRKMLFPLDDELEVCVMGYEEGFETLTAEDVQIMDLVKGLNHEVRYAGEHYEIMDLPEGYGPDDLREKTEICVVFCRSGRHVK